MPELGELVKEEYGAVSADETISRVISVLKKSGGAVIVREGDEVVGVVRERDLIRGSVISNPETKVKNFAIRTGVIRVHELSEETVARRFIEDSTPFVVIRLNKKFGVIRIEDFLKVIKHDLRDLRVRDVMNPDVVTVFDEDTAAKALAVMRSNGVDRVVVINRRFRAVGILTGKDVIERIFAPRRRERLGDLVGEKDRSLSISVRSIMSQPLITADPDDRIPDVIDKMLENEISSVVVTKRGFPEGILIKKDILECFIRTRVRTKFDIQAMFRDVVLDDFEKKRINEDLRKFMEKFREYFGDAVLFVYFKRYKGLYKGFPLINVRIKLTSDKGVFTVVSEGWGAEFALHSALKKLERRVLESKDIIRNRRALRRFYEEIFPEF